MKCIPSGRVPNSPKGIFWVFSVLTSLKISGRKKYLCQAMCVLPSLLLCPFLILFSTCCLNRRWPCLKLNETIFLFPQTCPPEKKFSSSLWLNKGSGISCRGSWNRCDSGQDYCEEEQKHKVKEARNILFLLLISARTHCLAEPHFTEWSHTSTCPITRRL